MIDIGSVLKAARENTKLSQREFAERLGIDQSKVSRVESGGVVVSDDDLARWLGAFREDDARRVKGWLSAPWSALEEPPPPWNHPDLDALASAATCAGMLMQAQVPSSLVPSVQRLLRETRLAASGLRSLKYRASLVGATAVGKSTAEAHGLDLKTPGGELVLPTGGGSTTVCEVHVEQGQDWGLVIETEPLDEVVRLVEDLCASIRPNERPPDERPAVPPEVRTALLNMAGLGPKTEVGPDGQSVRREPLRELAEREGDRLVSSVLLSLRLAERTATEMWWEAGAANDPLSWLRENLRKINRGLHPAVSLPRRVRVVVSRPVLPDSPYSLTLVDTRGVTDNVVRRQDLAECLAGDRTVTLLCSSFLNAPDLYVRSLMQYADEQEFPGWRNRVAVLLLARPAEPVQVRYEDTDELVDGSEDGVRIKEAHTRQQFSELNAADVAIATYNALADSPATFRAVVVGRIEAVRQAERIRIASLARSAKEMLDHAETHAIQAARAAVARDLLLVLESIENPSGITPRPQDWLLRQVAAAHPRAVWAMTRRQGTWRTLPLELHLSDGAAQIARRWAKDPLVKLGGVLDMLSKREDLVEASGLIVELREVADEARQAFVARSRDAVTATIWTRLRADLQLWADCEDEWVGGSGFRDRVMKRLSDWFDQNEGVLEDFDCRLRSAWRKRFVRPIKELCQVPQ